MFKRKKAAAVEQSQSPEQAKPMAPTEPVKTPEQLEVERLKKRADRLTSLADEARMWREFATGCVAGRWLYESYSGYFSHRAEHPRIHLTMDDETAQLWRDFALRMAMERESRLKEALGL